MPYKRSSRIARHFPSPKIWPFGAKTEFFNTHAIFHQLSINGRKTIVGFPSAQHVVGVEVKCFFWGENELTLDLRPEDVDSAEKAQGVFDLMKAIANTLNKRVLLTAENGSATRQWSEEYAIRVF